MSFKGLSASPCPASGPSGWDGAGKEWDQGWDKVRVPSMSFRVKLNRNCAVAHLFWVYFPFPHCGEQCGFALFLRAVGLCPWAVFSIPVTGPVPAEAEQNQFRRQGQDQPEMVQAAALRLSLILVRQDSSLLEK